MPVRLVPRSREAFDEILHGSDGGAFRTVDGRKVVVGLGGRPVHRQGERACDSPALYIFSLNSAINSCRRLRAPAVISENWMPIPAGVSFPLPVA